LTVGLYLAYNNLIVTAEMKTAPEVAPTTAGALIRPTGAELTSIGIMAPVRAFRKESTDGLRSLPDTRQALREGSEGKPALPLPDVP
jgi:hypothetical protein